MDPNTLRHLEYFSVPNNQTANPVDQSFSLTGAAPSIPPSSMWDAPTGLNLDIGQSASSSAAPTAFSLDSFNQASASTGLTSASPNPSLLSRSSVYGSQSDRALPTRPPRRRDGHTRKRSRLGPNANPAASTTPITPFDSADYWIEFDNEESLDGIPEGVEASRADPKGKGIRSMSTSQYSERRASAAGPTLKVEDYVDDDALENALSDEDGFLSSMNLAEHLSRIDSAPPAEVPPREGLYSTPLSWERPQPGLRMDSLIGLNSPALNEAEQRRLIAIAMNPGPSTGGLGSNLNLNFGGLNSGFNPTFGMGFGGVSISQGTSPGTVSPPRAGTSQPPRPAPTNPPKRQGSVSEKGKDKEKEKAAAAAATAVPGDRTAHNDIERKYRTNLKDRIAELRDAVPTLHTISENGGEEDGSQPSRTAKVSKGTILTKATEYIHYLERKNKLIAQEHLELSRRLQAFEQLLNATARASYTMPNYSRTLFDPRGFC
ncbi:helix-loop-helix DNA-binding domain-containing protein [Podospora appendiculata]|uniref:Helix-loop-helix DNA-binding domain-containing protein n=1 Tax=Podospora appendiculata TaxID=314037 RepID=A0AAE1CF56_9PEZI|nr:helix-loop-helix DNA-binding domain-containing protein [Podospora appendiculata]